MNKILSFLFLCFAPVVCQGAEYGVASFYSVKTNGGTTTASGKKLNDKALTAAHKFLPFYSKVRVIDLKTNKSIEVEITDNGPNRAGRIIDLSLAAGQILGLADKNGNPTRGITNVKLEIISLGSSKFRR